VLNIWLTKDQSVIDEAIEWNKC